MTDINFVLKRISSVESSMETDLNLSELDLEEIPEKVFQMTWLEKLVLTSNKLKNIPREITNLKKLKELDFAVNDIEEIPEFLLDLPNLKTLYLDNNSIYEIPLFIKDFPSLQFLLIERNPVQNIPYEIFAKRGNTFEAIKSYLTQVEKQGTKKIFEAKIIIIGSGGSGKTTLAQKIIDSTYTVPRVEDSTRGMEILDYVFSTTKGGDEFDFKAHIWDFGGQEIYHQTHQFFLTKRSLYLLVADNRKEDEDFEYWLSIHSILGKKSPIIIVSNERDGRKKEHNELKLKENFPSIVGFHKVEFRNNDGLPSLVNSIKQQLMKLDHVGKELPKKWIEIKNHLERDGRDYINYEEYLNICIKNGISDEKEARHISQFLHDLGIILHFQDDINLFDTVILNPKWGTKAVYKILDSEKVIENNGVITQNDFRETWSAANYPASK